MRTERFTTSERTISNRVKTGLGAIGIATGAFLSTACGGSEGAPINNENVLAVGDNIQLGNSVTETLTSEECSQQDIYQTAHIMGGTESRGKLFADVDSMLSRTKLMDGKERSGSQVEVTLSDEQKSQAWANYQRATEGFDPSEYNLTRGQLVVYGEGISADTDGYDGKLDDNANLCVVIKTLDGSVSAS